jgi:UDP-N-acetylglucosamine/UDP-N-acetylgalactosamine diphosphorylase
MTSETNHGATVAFFEEQDYFGYSAADIMFFRQEMIPAIDRSGKLILDAPDHIFTNPNGHGGSLKALWENGAIGDMHERGIEHIFYFQVDNVLTRICDPVYAGYHISGGSEMSNKVVRKKSPEEKMGVLCKINGRLGLIEYSDISEEDMHATYPDGSLKFWAGNIATHMLSVDFVERENKEGFRLPYHIAEKSIPYIDDEGRRIKPQEKNGIKFESFVFDALQDAEKSVSIEIVRGEEFSPLKNREGDNSPETVRRALNNTYGRWLTDAGYDLPRDASGNYLADIEISPLVALQAADLKKQDIEIDPEQDTVYVGQP